jgi:hypothetical protein
LLFSSGSQFATNDRRFFSYCGNSTDNKNEKQTNIAPSEQSQNPIGFNFLYATLIDV